MLDGQVSILDAREEEARLLQGFQGLTTLR